MDVDAIVAHGIGQDSGGTAGRRRNPQAAVEQLVVNRLRPQSVAVRFRKRQPVARLAPGFVVQHLVALHVIVAQADRVHLAAGDPRRHVPPKRFFHIDMRVWILAGERQEFARTRSLLFRGGDRQRLIQVEIQQGSAGSFVLARHHMVKAVLVETGHQRRRDLCRRPRVGGIPPGDHRCDVQILGRHQEFDFTRRTMDVQIARPPTFLFHVHKALHRHLAAVGVAAANLEVACPNAVFGATFHLERVPAGTKFEDGLAGQDEMVVPVQQLGRFNRLALRVFQMHAHGQRLLRLLVDRANLEFATRSGQSRAGDAKRGK